VEAPLLPDFETLRCFEAVATQLSFRAAARRLALSPAAVSARVRLLEEQLGARLLLRTTRRVALTEEGARLLAHVRELLRLHQRTVAAVLQPGAEPPLHLWVGTRFELGLSWLLPALPALRAAAPARTLHLHFGDGPELLAALREGRIDCAVTSARLVERSLSYQVLHPERYALVAAPRLLRRAPFAGPDDAPGQTWLDLSPDLPLGRYFLDQAGGSAPWRFGAVEHLGTIAAVRARLLQGVGVAVLPHYFVRQDLARGRLRQLFPRLRLPEDRFRLVWREGHPRAAALEQLARELRALPLR
jgi:DNA-binding transcriptional LysR family regulator